MSARDSLLLAAFAPELACLRIEPPPGWRVVLTGVGLATAGVATARTLAKKRPQRALFIGTCGAYDNRLDIGDCVAISEVIVCSVSEMQKRAFRPSIETTRWPATWGLPLPERIAAVTPAITSNREDAALLGQIADVEHLELAGVFAACHLAGIPVAAALVVANRVGPEANAQWEASHESMSGKLAETLKRLGVFYSVSDSKPRFAPGISAMPYSRF